VSLVTAGFGCALAVSCVLHVVANIIGGCLGSSAMMVIGLYLAGHGFATMAVMLPEGGKLEKVSKLVTGTITMYEFHGTRAMYYAFWNILYSTCAYSLARDNIIDMFTSCSEPRTNNAMWFYIDEGICCGFWCIMCIEIFLWFKKEKGTS
jgi:hypothetical protein